MTNIEKCTSYVLEKIESGGLEPGVRLGEPSLAREMGMDRASVRAAFERLAATGILERRARSGTYLRQMSVDDVRSANQVRCELEALGARLATQHATDEELRQLLATAKVIDGLTESYAAGQLQVWSSIRSLEIEFHTMVARLGRNSYLVSMMSRDSFLQVCFPFLAISNSLRQGKVREYMAGAVMNQEVAAAIQTRDAKRAEKLMRRHVEDALKLFCKAIEEADASGQ